MLTIIQKNSFKKFPWKNGKGSTLELSINPNASIDNFDWRLSIATVEDDGIFSDFSGYTRNLVLIDGEGVVLHHNKNQIDHLKKRLDLSTFDGANKTTAKLASGAITDFNLMTRTCDFDGIVETYNGLNRIILKKSQICFIYGLTNNLEIHLKDIEDCKILVVGDLMKLTNNKETGIKVLGENFIIVYINKLS